MYNNTKNVFKPCGYLLLFHSSPTPKPTFMHTTTSNSTCQYATLSRTHSSFRAGHIRRLAYLKQRVQAVSRGRVARAGRFKSGIRVFSHPGNVSAPSTDLIHPSASPSVAGVLNAAKHVSARQISLASVHRGHRRRDSTVVQDLAVDEHEVILERISVRSSPAPPEDPDRSWRHDSVRARCSSRSVAKGLQFVQNLVVQTETDTDLELDTDVQVGVVRSSRSSVEPSGRLCTASPGTEYVAVVETADSHSVQTLLVQTETDTDQTSGRRAVNQDDADIPASVLTSSSKPTATSISSSTQTRKLAQCRNFVARDKWASGTGYQTLLVQTETDSDLELDTDAQAGVILVVQTDTDTDLELDTDVQVGVVRSSRSSVEPSGRLCTASPGTETSSSRPKPTSTQTQTSGRRAVDLADVDIHAISRLVRLEPTAYDEFQNHVVPTSISTSISSSTHTCKLALFGDLATSRVLRAPTAYGTEYGTETDPQAGVVRSSRSSVEPSGRLGAASPGTETSSSRPKPTSPQTQTSGRTAVDQDDADIHASALLTACDTDLELDTDVQAGLVSRQVAVCAPRASAAYWTGYGNLLVQTETDTDLVRRVQAGAKNGRLAVPSSRPKTEPSAHGSRVDDRELIDRLESCRMSGESYRARNEVSARGLQRALGRCAPSSRPADGASDVRVDKAGACGSESLRRQNQRVTGDGIRRDEATSKPSAGSTQTALREVMNVRRADWILYQCKAQVGAKERNRVHSK
ncbi:hypothetical protein EXIGLDRAFT_692412 [Exidia glandulosa HHB12029]|uniref:Uncharacterized protein n=1 Tax=Exidia glandulosa HHB12029 TaxID=1314781 RepID=A0A165I1N3_EXIGL|nr:hypothetical protein EXIGLDRAFT_692412 [Exidia glandulosa HHB12029]